MKLSDYVIDYLCKQGVTHVFEMTGGAIVHLLDSTYDREDMDCVSVHHEQAAAFAAEGYSRASGKLGVALATSGPGALNLLTGIGSCYFDSVPCLFITGQVNTYEYKFDKPIRQLGFQETDIVSIVKPIVKLAEMVLDAELIRYQLEQAIFIAHHGRPGPVVLDIPMNIQRADIDPLALRSFFEGDNLFTQSPIIQYPSEDELLSLIEMLKQAERPMILAGGGIRAANAVNELRQLVDLTGVPLVSSLMGVDVIPGSHPSSAGLIGSYGNRYSNLALANCDFLLILGSRLDTRQTGTRPETFARAARKVHVEIDHTAIDGVMQIDLAIRSDVRQFLINLNQYFEEKKIALPQYNKWLETISKYKKSYPSGQQNLPDGSIDPNRFMEVLSSRSSEGDLIVLDVGQHQMWASQSFQLREGQRLLNSGGMGAMGFALPTAIGAAMNDRNRQIIVITGDGGLQVNIQELQTIVQQKLSIKIFVMNNHHLGMVRQFQDHYLGGRLQSTVEGYGCPDFVRVAKAYGIPAMGIKKWVECSGVIDAALHVVGSVLVNVDLRMDTTVTPKLSVNRPIEDMHPLLDREELRSVMLIEPLSEEVN